MKIRPLHQEDGVELSRLLEKQSPDYRADFHPFPDEGAEAMAELLSSARKDRYRAVIFEDEWVAFYMLRGWDAGFDRPSFGLLVDEARSGRGIGTLCLHAAMAECRLAGADSCMLKVARENLSARKIYERAGFRFESLCPATGHEILSIRWKEDPVGWKGVEG